MKIPKYIIYKKHDCKNNKKDEYLDQKTFKKLVQRHKCLNVKYPKNLPKLEF